MAALDEILQRHPVWRGNALAQHAKALPTGFAALDAELPGGGWPRGALTELFAARAGIGELELLLPAMAALTRAGRRSVWLAPPYVPYAPALAAACLDLVNLLVVRPASRRDALWAAEQALRSRSCHALVAWPESARYAELQRLALAAEAGGAAAFLFRPIETAGEPSPACLRLGLEAAGVELAVRFAKRRGAPAEGVLHLHLQRPFHVVARPAFPRPAAGDARADRRLGVPVHA